MRLALLLVVLKWAIGWLLYGLAQAALALGPIGRGVARPLLGGAVRMQPNNLRMRAYRDYLRGLRMFSAGATDEALKLLHRAHRVAPDDETVHLDWAVALTMAGRYDQAIGALEQLGQDIERPRHEQQYWSALGWSYLRTGRFPLAENAMKRAAEYGLATPDLRLIMSLALLGQQGWVDKATVRGSLAKRPRNTGMLLEFGYYLAKIGKRGEAERLLAVLPESMLPRGWRIVAQHSLDEDNTACAQWAIDKLDSLDPGSAGGLLLGCEVAARADDWSAAVAGAHQAVDHDPTSLNVLETAGRIMVLAGEHESAFRYMTQALAGGSRNALAGGVVALHLLEQDKTDRARLVFRVQRAGDELACVYAHTAMAWLLQIEEKPAEALSLAAQACDFWNKLPAWAATEPVCRDILPRLTSIAESIERSADETTRCGAVNLRRRLDRAAPATDGD